MYQAEAKGLQQLAKTQTIKVPKVVLKGEMDGGAYLVLEFIENKSPSSIDFEKLGQQLAALHQSSIAEYFGNDHDNFIGSLRQSNMLHPTWPEFYVAERLMAQFDLALQKGLLELGRIPKEEKMMTVCENLFDDAAPSLLHGDLWGGNYLISEKGIPHLIDPAVYWGHSEVDLAMSKLFGGFGATFFDAYHEIIAPHKNQAAITEIYQLYYLLVHLNLFGSSYLGSVLKITQKYFR